ncbi:hypothetical protein Tco_0129386 [Tanacetum coccineum]
MHLHLWSYKVVSHRYSNPMIQPKPEGSTQGYLLVSVEVLRHVLERLNTSAGNPVNEILLKLNLPDHRILKDGGEVQAKGTSLSLKSMITTPYLLEKEKKMKSASTRMKTQHSSSVELFGFLSLLIIMSVDDADDSISNNSDKSNENLNVVSTELYASQIYSKTAYDMWIDLKDTYDKDDGSFLMGLDDTYQPIRSNILTREPLPLVTTDFTIVSGEESHRNVTSMNNASKTPSATAFDVKE